MMGTGIAAGRSFHGDGMGEPIALDRAALANCAPQAEDAALMAAVRAGERDAFATLVERHKDTVVNYLTRLTADRDRAEDLAQETFIRLWRAPHYDEQGKLLPFLFRIATNLVRTEERRARRWRLIAAVLPHVPTPAAVPAHGTDPAAAAERREVRGRLVRAIAALPLNYRVPLVLRDVEDMSYDEIAAALGCPEGTVKSRINRARTLLREQLGACRGPGDGGAP
jgi:RNA polymerase sigma-70 factor (ECF subfamily)